ncbi:MAG: DUF3576 domain-containing protein [Pseudomonadota bacterium]
MTRSVFNAAAVLAVVGLMGCSGAREASIENLETDREGTGGGLIGDTQGGRLTDIDLGGSGAGAGSGGLTAVNRHLWRASLDTLAFLPLSSTDPFTGVVATDWAASPDAPQERFKVTAYVQGPSLSASTLKVAVFREIRGPQGSWGTAPVSGTTARQLEDAILVRARQLRIEEREQG